MNVNLPVFVTKKPLLLRCAISRGAAIAARRDEALKVS
jgi:hypothetical protein